MEKVVKGCVSLTLKTDRTTIKTLQNIGICSFVDGCEKLIKTRNSFKKLLADVLTKSSSFLIIKRIVKRCAYLLIGSTVDEGIS